MGRLGIRGIGKIANGGFGENVEGDEGERRRGIVFLGGEKRWRSRGRKEGFWGKKIKGMFKKIHLA